MGYLLLVVGRVSQAKRFHRHIHLPQWRQQEHRELEVRGKIAGVGCVIVMTTRLLMTIMMMTVVMTMSKKRIAAAAN